MKNKIIQGIGFTSIAFLIVTADSIPTWGLAILVILALIVAAQDYENRKTQTTSDTPIGDQLAVEMGIDVRDFIVKDGRMDDVA